MIDKKNKQVSLKKEKMLKSGVSQEKKKDEEEGNDSTPETVTRLTRNRLLLQQRQKNSADGLDDPKSENTEGVKKNKSDEDGDADKSRPSSSLDGDKEANSKPEPHLLSKTKTEDTVSALKLRREKEKKTIIESKDENGSEKKVFVMKTRSGRSTQAVNMSAINQQNKESDENGKNLKKKKGNSSYRRSKKLYDEAGALLASGKDYCDCLEVDCPGCHFPCKKCGSEKCGTECRCERTWVYDEVKIEGTGIIIKNHAC